MGILGITATDTSALCGSSPKACQKKYDSLPLRTDYYNELGLRILIGHIARIAMKHEKGITPLFSHCTRHYLKTYVQVQRVPGDATEPRTFAPPTRRIFKDSHHTTRVYASTNRVAPNPLAAACGGSNGTTRPRRVASVTPRFNDGSHITTRNKPPTQETSKRQRQKRCLMNKRASVTS